jgi:hypothetical protein
MIFAMSKKKSHKKNRAIFDDLFDILFRNFNSSYFFTLLLKRKIPS